ncbi:MAG TPA: sodium-dependent transporter [Jiangellaceae bacterium]|nr:sodium-dependent transporter [Jiangellaceae bacterium]
MSDEATHTNGEQREVWTSKWAFILAAIGSAVGLGNIWRYPAQVYENGGGAFLLPYFIALATAGIPILILEYSLGHRSGRGAPFALRSLSRRWEWLGWWQAGVAFVISTYYVIILAWCLSYVWFSFGQQWGSDTESFFFGEYLGSTAGPGEIGGINWSIFLVLAISWAIVYAIMRGGINKGIARTAKVLLPTLLVILILLAIRGVTLDGAVDGLNNLFTPDFAALGDPQVWVAAYGQVFFSLSIAFAIMIAYSSYLPRRTDLSNSALIVGLSNAGVELLAAIGIFSVLGFVAGARGVPISEVVTDGIGLAFVAFPSNFNEFPALGSFFAVLFFVALFVAGLTSMVSILEAVIVPLRDKFGLGRTAAVNIVCGLCAVISIGYTTGAGLYFLDIVDRWANNYGIVLAGLTEVIFVSWIVRQLPSLQEHVNSMSYVRIGGWWRWTLAIVTPVVLIVSAVFNFITDLSEPYEGYPTASLILLGWGLVAALILIGFIMQAVPDRGPGAAAKRNERT